MVERINYREKLRESIDDGIVDAAWLGLALLDWISTDEAERFCDKHCIFEEDDDEDNTDTDG